MSLKITNLTLKHLVKENQFLVNGFVNKVQTTEDNLLKLKIHTKQGDRNVIITENSFFVSKKSEQAKQNPGGFSALLKKFLYNQRIISIKQKGADRIVIFEFPEKYLIIEMFAKGNIILCEKDYTIIKAMRKEKWKDRELAKEKKYEFPKSRGKNPTEISEKEYLEELEKNEKSFFVGTSEIINVAPQILEIVFEKNKIEKKKTAKKAEKEEAKKILEGIKKIYSKEEKEKVTLSENTLYTINTGKKIEKEYESLNEALNDLTERKIERTEKKKKEKPKIDYDKQKEELAEKEKQAQEKGNQIYLHYNEIKETIKEIKQLEKKGYEKEEIIKNVKRVKLKEFDPKKEKIIIEV